MKLPSIALALFLLPASYAQAQHGRHDESNRPVRCATIYTSFDAHNGHAYLRLINNCRQALDFSNSAIIFSGATPYNQPWGPLPAGFSWMNWQVQYDGFTFQKNPADTWQNLMLHVGQELNLTFNADQEPYNPRLYLGHYSYPTPY